MKRVDINIPVVSVTYDELSESQQQLVDLARESFDRSYAPYSHFNVGAAIQLDNGEIVTGSNQENAAFSSGTCAERTACYYAHATYPDARFMRIAIAAKGPDGLEVPSPVSPCGACRQALVEYEKLAGHKVEVLLVGSEEIYIFESVSSLLPLTFCEF